MELIQTLLKLLMRLGIITLMVIAIIAASREQFDKATYYLLFAFMMDVSARARDDK